MRSDLRRNFEKNEIVQYNVGSFDNIIHILIFLSHIGLTLDGRSSMNANDFFTCSGD